MDQLTMDIDPDLRIRLDALAELERTSPQELAKEAIRRLVWERKRPAPPSLDEEDPYAPLRAMIGLASGGKGRTDSSIHHDYRPGDDG